MRNVVLVTVDSLRADHCGPYDAPNGRGPDGTLTPTLDALAADGVVFERAVAPGPRTPSSIPVALTGEPLSGGVYDTWQEKRRLWRARRERLRRHLTRHAPIAARLAARGYDTGAVTANPWTATDTGFARGFDAFHSVGETTRVEGGLLNRALDRLLDVDRNGWLLTWRDYFDVVEATRASLSEPYFLWVFLMDPHQPYLAPRRYREENTLPEMYYANLRYNRFHGYVDELPTHLHERLRRAYRDAVRSVDGFLERLLGDLDGDRPVVCVHADHGEAFAEHGFYSHRPQLYEENVHVPLVLGGVEATARVDAPVSLSILPELLLEATEGTVDPDGYGRPYVVSRTEEGERVGVRTRDWKYVRGGESWAYLLAGGGEELYDLRSDPGERRNRLPGARGAADLFARLCDRREATLDERDRIADGAADLEGG